MNTIEEINQICLTDFDYRTVYVRTNFQLPPITWVVNQMIGLSPLVTNVHIIRTMCFENFKMNKSDGIEKSRKLKLMNV